MVRSARVDATAYYNTLPTLGHECGDVWANLPSFGVLGKEPCTGVVITPACDLSWQKSDTLTFLPIVPIRSYFSMDAALPLIMERFASSLAVTGYDADLVSVPRFYECPSAEQLTSLSSGVAAFRSSKTHPAKIIAALNRVDSAIDILRFISNVDVSEVSSYSLATLFGSEWEKTKDKIIRNSFSTALHFLPKDGQDEIFSAVPSHSVALFRYPITIPVKMLNYAEEVSDSAWGSKVNGLAITDDLKRAFLPARPIKLASLKSAFLSDLLTRFSALYNRVGSPDFTDETVATYSAEVGS